MTRLLIALTVFAFHTQALLACPTCKDGLQSDEQAMNVARGFYWSILFMLSMPLLIFSGLSLYFYLLIRKARREQQLAVSA